MLPLAGLVDSHCHLDRLDLTSYDQNFNAMMKATREAGVSHMLCIGVDLETFPDVLTLAEQHANVHCTVGVHPLYKDSREPTVTELVELAQHPRVVAIGETGLDYFYAKGDNRWQRDRFSVHIEAAAKTDLPLVIHTRGARADTIAMLRDAGGPQGTGAVRGVLHCFTEDLDMAEQAIELGFSIAISGIATFNNAADLRDIIKALPIESLLIETDSPWLAPVPYRGKKNEPRYVVEVAKLVADLKGLDVQDVVDRTRENFFSLFSKAQPESLT